MMTHLRVQVRDFRFNFAVALVIAFTLAGVVGAQSTDRDRPTPLTSNEIRGEQGPKGVTYYYSFKAGPGELVLTVDGKVQQRSAIMNVSLLGADARPLGKRVSLVMTQDGVRKVERIRLASQQSVIMQLSLDDTKNNIQSRSYLVRVEGAVEIPR